MSEGESQPVTYQPGQVVNGHVWTGTAWLLVQQPQPESNSTWRLFMGILALVVAAFAAVQGLYWFFAFVRLDGEGNQFAGLLGLLGVGAIAVAVGFGIAGTNLLTKKR